MAVSFVAVEACVIVGHTLVLKLLAWLHRPAVSQWRVVDVHVAARCSETAAAKVLLGVHLRVADGR